MKDNERKGIAVVVATKDRGVFFGYVRDAEDTTQRTIVLEWARMVVYWPVAVHGVVGLSVTGPLSGSRVSPAALSIVLQDVSCCMACTPAAVKAWESEPWS